MAEVTGLRNNALPYPIYGAPFGVTFPLLDADGDPISPSSPDSEISKNGDTFADCTNEATEIASSSGSCYLLLTGTELTTDVATVQIKSTGAKTTVLTLYPRKLVTIRSGTSASGGVATDTIVLDGSASAVDDFYNGMVCIATIDTVVEVRMIVDYVGSTQTATVVPDWNTAPDSNDTFVIKLPEGVQVNQANVTHAASTAWNSGAIGASTLASDTIAAAKIAAGAITSAKFAAGAIDATAIADNAIDAGAIAADAITAAKIADGAIDANTFAAGAITASAIAADAIGASELAADAVTEIQSGLSTLDAAGIRTAVGLASANLDTQLTACKGTTQITEAYAANGVAPTRDQAIMAIHQMLMQFAISSTTITVKKLDNSTTAFTVTLDDATTPTSAVRT